MDSNENPVWIAAWPTLLVVGFGLACGGGGATFGENSPGNAEYGGGTYVDDAFVTPDTPEGVGENGSLAVDPDTEYTYTLQTRRADGEVHKRLVVVPPDEPARELLDMTDYVDVRVLFGNDSVLVMAEPAHSEEAVAEGRCLQPRYYERESNRCGDEMIWFDKSARQQLRSQRTRARYNGTRLSPKRNYLVVADNFHQPAPIHLLDAETGHANVVPQDGAWFEGMWLHGQDVFVTAHFGRVSEEDDAAYLEIREWFPRADAEDAELGRSICYHTGEVAPDGCTSYVVPDIDPMFFVGFSWVGISPDDRFVAVPAQDSEGNAVVFVIDRQTDELHAIDDTFGPVGFTPDSKTMIGFGFEEPYEPRGEIEERFNRGGGEGAYLAIVDLETMQVTREPTPQFETPTFFVSHDSSDVVIVETYFGEGLMIVDLDKQTAQQMPGPNVAQRGRTVALQDDPTRPDVEVDARVLSASDLSVERDIRGVDGLCGDRVCMSDGVEATLHEFVSRNGHQELWMIESGELVRVDLEFGFVEKVPISGTPQHINIQPNRDRLVIDALHEQKIRFFDPETREVAGESSIELGWVAQ